MKILLAFIILFINVGNVFAHSSHIKNLSKIEMEVLRNGKVIGFSDYYFEHKKDLMIVKNETNFLVEMAGIKIFSIKGNSEEVYENEKLISFKSSTLQNKKRKFVKLIFDENKNLFIIDGSSFKGETGSDNVIGNWWNSKILQSKSQISPLSGSVKEQIVRLIGKDEMILNGKKYKLFKFNLKSSNEELPKDKKLDFNIWLEPNEGLIFKVQYNRLGNWEYKIKNFY
tara:strand:- start:2330 stop:3010 length:681 start_codon:yes stop_codon:yes gene_type:complete